MQRSRAFRHLPLPAVRLRPSVLPKCACPRPACQKTAKLAAPCRHLGPDGVLCKGGATDVQPHPRLPASGNGASDATMPSSPGKDGSTSAPPPWKAHLQSASTVFRSCPSYRRRPLGASSCQQPGSPRSGRRQNFRSGLSEAYGTVAAAEWGDPGCVADTGFSRYLAGEGRMVLRLIVINVAQGREAGA